MEKATRRSGSRARRVDHSDGRRPHRLWLCRKLGQVSINVIAMQVRSAMLEPKGDPGFQAFFDVFAQQGTEVLLFADSKAVMNESMSI
jgi:hypothetical protein